MSNIRTITITNGNKAGVEETIKNVLTPLIGAENLTISENTVSWNQEELNVITLKALEKALIERAKLGLLGVNEETGIVDSVSPELNLSLTADCIYYIGQSQASFQKFIEEVLVFANIDTTRQVILSAPHSAQVLQIQKPVVIVCNLTPQEMGKIRSNANFKKWGITGGKIVGNLSSGAGLMAHTIFEEAIAPATVNLSIAGAKISKSAIITAAKVGDVVLDEGSKAILEIAETFSNSNGYGKAKERIIQAWAIASKKDPNNMANDNISF